MHGDVHIVIRGTKDCIVGVKKKNYNAKENALSNTDSDLVYTSYRKPRVRIFFFIERVIADWERLIA